MQSIPLRNNISNKTGTLNGDKGDDNLPTIEEILYTALQEKGPPNKGH